MRRSWRRSSCRFAFYGGSLINTVQFSVHDRPDRLIGCCSDRWRADVRNCFSVLSSGKQNRLNDRRRGWSARRFELRTTQRPFGRIFGKVQPIENTGCRKAPESLDIRTKGRMDRHRGRIFGMSCWESLPHGLTGSSIVLTCAATIRQPCGNRTHVCIVRVILPGARG
jgi:hypothetical protein